MTHTNFEKFNNSKHETFNSADACAKRNAKVVQVNNDAMTYFNVCEARVQFQKSDSGFTGANRSDDVYPSINLHRILQSNMIPDKFRVLI